MGLSASPLIQAHKRYYKDSLAIMGSYRLCMQNQIQPDFVSKVEVLDGNLSKYKLLILPYSVSITTDLAKQIELFVKNGGKVISDGLCGYFTDNTWGAEVCPAGGLDQVFGLHVKSDYETINEENIIGHGKVYENVAKVIAERMVLHEGALEQATFENGMPAVVLNQYGQGQTVYFGTLFFANTMWNYSASTNQLFKKALEAVSYKPSIQLSGPTDWQNVEVRILEDKEGEFVFIINHAVTSAIYELALPLGVKRIVTEIVSETDVDYVVRGDDIVLTGNLKPDEVKIFKCDIKRV
jgi:beta-galactosidase GanA